MGAEAGTHLDPVPGTPALKSGSPAPKVPLKSGRGDCPKTLKSQANWERGSCSEADKRYCAEVSGTDLGARSVASIAAAIYEGLLLDLCAFAPGKTGTELQSAVPLAEFFCNADSFIPLGHALGSREGTDLELLDTPAQRQMNNGYVFGFARTC